MDLNQADSSGNSSPADSDDNTSDKVTASSAGRSDGISGSPVDNGITFDNSQKTQDHDDNVSLSEPPITNEMKLDSEDTRDEKPASLGIENGSNRFDSTPSMPAFSPPEAAMPKIDEPQVKSDKSEDAELILPAVESKAAPYSPVKDPEGEILTTFVNTQNYAIEEDKPNPSMPIPTTKNETNSSMHIEQADSQEHATPVVTTPDPMLTNEAESTLSPSSLAMPAIAEAPNNELPEAEKISAEVIPNSSQTQGANTIVNHVPLSEHYDYIASSPQSASTTFVPVKKSAGLKWLWITLGSIFGVLFVFAGLVGATETGMINWQLDKYYSQMGLQKMWKGLPFDSRGALLISATQMAKINQSHIVADTTINVKTGDNSALHSYLQTNGAKFAADNAANPNVATGGDIESPTDNSSMISEDYPSQSTFDNFSVKLKVDSQASLAKNTTQVSIESSLLSSALSMYGIVGGADNTIAINEKTVDEKYYIRIPILSLIIGSEGNKWVMFDKSDIDSMASTESVNVSNIASDFDKYSKVIKSGEKTGVEEIDGAKVNKYHFVIDFAALISLLDENQTGMYDSLTGYTAEADVWIGQKDHYMRKLTMMTSGTIEGTTVSSVTNVNVSDINKDFIVTVPSDSEIEKEGFGAIFNKIEKAVSEDESAASSGTTVVPQ